MEVVSAIITPVVESLLVPVKRHLGFLFSSTKYVGDMLDRKRKLECAATDMKRRKELNDVKNLMVPDRVPSWLEEAQAIINKEGDSISAGGNGCLDMKKRYKAGKHCVNVIERIDCLMDEESNMVWTNEQIPLGMVHSATPEEQQDVKQNIFTSRQLIFERALQLLQPDNTTQMVALCGMGGIGKTTMMEELRKDVKNTKLFDWVVTVVIGNSTDPITAIKDAIAQYTGANLSETSKEARAERLKKTFLEMSQNGKKKILIILDDLWNFVDLKDIGLASPLPTGFKLFLTSRDETLCRQMGVETSSVLRMVGLEEAEAKQLFWETTGPSDGAVDHQLNKLGEDIIKRCGGLPMAIKTIALALRGKKKDAWKLAISRLERHDLQDLQGHYDVVHHIFEISYEGLQIDDQKIFILSGLFPDDFDIPLEDLMRYGWGLKLFVNVRSLFEARLRTNTSVDNLIRANLLVESDRKGCVKMHDLARSFVLSNISEFKQASVVNRSDMSEWPTQDTRESCERIFLKCEGMSEFPQHFVYPNLKLLKLMMNDYEEDPLKFPDGFYTRMKQLQVISYLSIPNPSLVPISLECSTSLRVLCLCSCSLMDDLSYLGHLSNLEILSFADCGIKNLPSVVGKLRKLKLLELTGCDQLCIGDGVFQNLDNLEELYMRNLYDEVIGFTEDNCEGLEMVSKKLTALEVQFFNNNIQPDNVSFKKLERFRISIGCQLDRIFPNDDDVYSYENTLRLVASCEEVRASEINELFEKTEQLYLQVEDMNHLEDVLMHPSDQYSFCNLKRLHFKKCENLKYLFTVNVASTLTNLEKLEVSSCGVLGSLIHDENNGAQVIIFRKLKGLVLFDLPVFVGLCDNVNIVMELPELVEPTLVGLPNITCIFGSSNNISATTIPLLNKQIEISEVDDSRVAVLFSSVHTLYHVSSIELRRFKQVEVIFDIQIPYVGIVTPKDDEQPLLLPCLTEMRLIDMKSMTHLWKCNWSKFLMLHNYQQKSSFQNLTTICMKNCKIIEYLFSPLMATLLSNLKKVDIHHCERIQEVVSNRDDDDETEESTISTSTSTTMNLFPSLDCLTLDNLENLKRIGGGIPKGTTDHAGNDNFTFSVPWSLGQYSRQITINRCHALSTVIPSYAADQLQKIEVLSIYDCSSMMEVFETKEFENSPVFGQVSGGRDDTTLAAAIPRLKSITMHKLPNLKELHIGKCHRLVDIFAFSTFGSLGLLEKLSIRNCKQLKVIVREEHGEQTTTTSKAVIFPCLKSIILADLPNLKGFFFGMNEFQLPLLDELSINGCPQMMVLTSLPLRASKLKYIDINGGKYCTPECCSFFTRATLPQTPSQSSDNTNPSITISKEFLSYSHYMIEINWLDRECQVIFSYDELLQLQNLEKLHAACCESVLEVFDVGTGVRCSDSSQTVVKLPKLSDVVLGNLMSLKYIWKSNGRTILEFPNLTKVYINNCNQLEHVFTSSMVGSLLQLKRLSIQSCQGMEVIVKEDQEEEEGGGDGKVNEITLPCLKSLELTSLDSLKGFCLGNVDYSLPSLDSMKIWNCKSLTIFTKGRLFVPKLKVMETSLGNINLAEEQDVNSFIITKRQEGFHFGNQD